jgi:hypothetical protein
MSDSLPQTKEPSMENDNDQSQNTVNELIPAPEQDKTLEVKPESVV